MCHLGIQAFRFHFVLLDPQNTQTSKYPQKDGRLLRIPKARQLHRRRRLVAAASDLGSSLGGPPQYAGKPASRSLSDSMWCVLAWQVPFLPHKGYKEIHDDFPV